jgi:hypothetical protein
MGLQRSGQVRYGVTIRSSAQQARPSGRRCAEELLRRDAGLRRMRTAQMMRATREDGCRNNLDDQLILAGAAPRLTRRRSDDDHERDQLVRWVTLPCCFSRRLYRPARFLSRRPLPYNSSQNRRGGKRQLRDRSWKRQERMASVETPPSFLAEKDYLEPNPGYDTSDTTQRVS